MDMPVLAIVVPCYNEEEVLKQSYFEISSALQSLIEQQKISSKSYICFVDDGSTDKSWEIIKKISKYNDAKGIKLSKDFGHQSAQLAGLVENNADIYITTDADLQDDLNTISEMIDKYKEGFDIVYGIRNNRKVDGFLKRTTAELYYKILKILKINSYYNHADFRLMSKKIVNILSELKESNLYLRGLVPSLGFKSCCVYYSRKKRLAGKSKFNFSSCLSFALEGLTSFSSVLLHLITILGISCIFLSIIFGLYIIMLYFAGKELPKYWQLLLSIYFISSIQLTSLGIIGEYIGKIYKETKQRPKFIVEQKTE